MKRKPVNSLLTALLLASVLVVAVACGGGGQSPSPAGDVPAGNEGGQAQQEDQPQPITLRIVSDTPTPPHPAAVAIEQFKADFEAAIPGSEVRTYFAGALYNIDEAMEATESGNLELVWGQLGKAAGWDPWVAIPSVPAVYTTVGAVTEGFAQSETAKMVADRMAARGITLFGYGDMSWYIGVGAGSRIVTLDDWAGKKIRTYSATVNALVEAWGGSPVTLSMGEVPSALAAGTIDGLITSSGAWVAVRDQAPYYTVAGIGGLASEWYYLAGNTAWFESLPAATREILQEHLDKLLEYQKTLAWCSDYYIRAEYEVTDPSQPGFYFMSADETKELHEAAGYGRVVGEAWKEHLPPEAHEWVDKFIEEGVEITAQYPEGSHPFESMGEAECAPYKDILMQ